VAGELIRVWAFVFEIGVVEGRSKKVLVRGVAVFILGNEFNDEK
jgi:hypothetical protein